MRLYFASANPGKLREFQAAAQSHGIEVELVPGIGELPACVEEGVSFEDNARQKARHYSQYVQGLVFADDSGICVDALGGAPGIHSARFAGARATDAENNRKLLRELERIEEGRNLTTGPGKEREGLQDRSAHYVCVIALAKHGQILAVVEGRVDGKIIDMPKGSGGFGYDPYFFYPPLGRTFAELKPEEKFAISHRGEAFRKLLEFIEENRDVL